MAVRDKAIAQVNNAFAPEAGASSRQTGASFTTSWACSTQKAASAARPACTGREENTGVQAPLHGRGTGIHGCSACGLDQRREGVHGKLVRVQEAGEKQQSALSIALRPEEPDGEFLDARQRSPNGLDVVPEANCQAVVFLAHCRMSARREGFLNGWRDSLNFSPLITLDSAGDAGVKRFATPPE